MTARLKSKPRVVAEPVRSPERQRLADAIARHADVVAKVGAVEHAVRAAQSAAADDRAALANAKKEISAAETRAADSLVNAALGVPPPPGPTPEAAHAAVVRLEEKAGHHERAIAVLHSKLAAARNAADLAKDEIQPHVYAVLKADPHVERLYRDFANACKKHAALFHIVSNLPISDIKPPGIAIDHTPDYALARAWFEYVEKLVGDADAELST